MTNFAQRYGYEPIESPFQREKVDKELRTKLWNVLSVVIWDRWEFTSEWRSRKPVSEEIEDMVRRLWINYFNHDLDSLPDFKERYDRPGAYDVIKNFFFSCEWFRVYTFLEALAQDRSNLFSPAARDWINQEL